MTRELSEARKHVAAAVAGVGVPVHDQPPRTISPPCIVILPGSPWIVPRGHVGLDVTVYANPAGGNASALTRLEDLTEAVRHALYIAQCGPGVTDSPITDDDAGVMSATIPTVIRMQHLE